MIRTMLLPSTIIIHEGMTSTYLVDVISMVSNNYLSSLAGVMYPSQLEAILLAYSYSQPPGLLPM